MRTALICTEEPDAFVDLADAKAQLRVTDTDDDTLITALCSVACAGLEGADGPLKRAIGEQTWQLVLPHFVDHLRRGDHHRFRDFLHGNPAKPWNAIEIPLPPIDSISSVKYYDANNAQQTLAADTDYTLVDRGTETSFILPTSQWPAHYRRPDAVTIEFVAGYEDVPRPIWQAAILIIKQLYDLGEKNTFVSGETVFGVGSSTYAVSAAAAQIVQDAADRLLFNYRILGR